MANKNNNKLSKQLTLSCTSAGFAELITLPFDTVKVAIQTAQSDLVKSENGVQYKGTYFINNKNNKNNLNLNKNNLNNSKLTPIKCATEIWKNNGINGFYNAWIPSVLRQTLYTGIRLGSYEYFKDNYGKHIDYGVVNKMAFGGFCGLIGNSFAIPFDITKTKIQSRNPDFQNIKVRTVMHKIWQTEGMRGFFRGFLQTAQKSILVSSIQLPLYFTLQEKLNDNLKDNTVLRTTLASIGTTIGVTATVYPVDLCKSIVMNQTNNDISRLGTYKIVRNLIINDGFFSLYRGVSMGLARAIPHFLITAICYEKLKDIFD